MPSEPYVVQRRLGSLIEARVFHLGTVEDVDRYIGVLAGVVSAGVGAGMGVLCADHRPADIYSQAVTDRLVESFMIMNAHLVRVAIVTGVGKPTLYMQLRRICREAAYEARQVFQVPEPALAHLAVALSPPEIERARAFLDEFREP